MNIRQKLTPQMQDYDALSHDWHPYVMFSSKSNYNSKTVNTDELGFRKSKFHDMDISTAECLNYAKVSIVAGGSAAFGVGSTADLKTLSSHIGNKINEPWLNFGGRAFNSTQEFILFTQHLKRLPKISKVVLFSGLNNLYLSQFLENIYSPFFFSNHFYSKMELSRKRILTKFMKSRLNDHHNSLSSISLTSAANCQLNDLFLWKKFSEALNFELIFILQPFAHWSKSNLSPEETLLFRFLDSKIQEGVHWKELSSEQTYFSYSEILKNYSRHNKIIYLDMNSKLPSDKWLFVDRVHLNDSGYEAVAKATLEFLG